MTIARLVLAVLATIAAAAPASAQTVDAEVLFREGKKLMKEGKIAAGCEKLDASARIESSVGTLLNLADCREKNGQLATAWATFQKAAAAAKVANDSKRQAEALRREKLLAPRLSYLTISISEANRLSGLTITRNGTPADPALWNTSVPVDPGDYEVVAEAPAHERWSTHVHVDSGGQHANVDVPKLAASSGPPPMPETPTEKTSSEHPARGPVAAGNASGELRDTAPSPFTPMRKLALGIGGAGVVGIGLGTYFGLHARSLERQSDALCPSTACGDLQGVSLNSDARSSGRNATIAFVAGGAAVGAAAVLWFVGAPRTAGDVALAPAIDGGRVGLTVLGQF